MRKLELLKKKQAGIVISRERPTPQPQNAAKIIEALRASIAQEQTIPARPKHARKRIEGQGEILLPIPGSKIKNGVAASANRRKGLSDSGPSAAS
jgi:DNA end-binding protein Ku